MTKRPAVSLSKPLRARLLALLCVGLACAAAVVVVIERSTDGQAATDAPDSTALVFRDDFDRNELGPGWGTYSGQPGGDPYSWWDPAQVSLDDGSLVLTANRNDQGQWITGGVSNASIAQTYGHWEVRFRVQAADDITVHFLLWPLSENWPPEIDFYENFGGDRQGGSAFLHSLVGGERRQHEYQLPETDFTSWHTVGVDWREGVITFLLDGQEWMSVESDEVPDEPMWLAMQAQAGGCERSAEYGNDFCPAVGTREGTRVEIDWVEVRR